MEKLVSIIIVTHNEINHVAKSLDAIRNQKYRAIEIIVYDNNSQDETVPFIKERYPEVRIIEGKRNLGFGGGINEAAKAANGIFLALLNCDACVDENWLEPLVKVLNSDPSIGAAGAELVSTENCGIVLSHGTGIHFSGVTYARDYGIPSKERMPFEVGGISGGAFIIPKELFAKIGGFEDSFFLYYEDTDLSLRLRALGKRCVIVPAAKVKHSSKLLFGYNKLFYLERNRYLSLFSLLKTPVFLAMFPSILTFELISWLYCLLRGWEGIRAKSKAWVDVFRRRHWITNRRKIYANGKIDLNFFLGAFTSNLDVHYVYSNQLIATIASLLGWITAAPFLYLARLLTRAAKSRMLSDVQREG